MVRFRIPSRSPELAVLTHQNKSPAENYDLAKEENFWIQAPLAICPCMPWGGNCSTNYVYFIACNLCVSLFLGSWPFFRGVWTLSYPEGVYGNYCRVAQHQNACFLSGPVGELLPHCPLRAPVHALTALYVFGKYICIHQTRIHLLVYDKIIRKWEVWWAYGPRLWVVSF